MLWKLEAPLWWQGKGKVGAVGLNQTTGRLLEVRLPFSPLKLKKSFLFRRVAPPTSSLRPVMSLSTRTTKYTVLLLAYCAARRAYTLDNPRLWQASCTRRRDYGSSTDCECTRCAIHTGSIFYNLYSAHDYENGNPVIHVSFDFLILPSREFLTANQLAKPIRDITRYHIQLEAAHVTLAQAYIVTASRSFHWLDTLLGTAVSMTSLRMHCHASRMGWSCLFDAGKPHFSTWLWFYNEDQ